MRGCEGGWSQKEGMRMYVCACVNACTVCIYFCLRFSELCMLVRIHMCACVFVRACVRIFYSVCVCTCVRMCMRGPTVVEPMKWLGQNTNTHTHTYTHAHTHTHPRIHTYTHTQLHTRTCTHTHAHTHTHTHTHTYTYVHTRHRAHRLGPRRVARKRRNDFNSSAVARIIYMCMYAVIRSSLFIKARTINSSIAICGLHE
jgi:hypothetical protein